jgi:hypothetical protein
MGDTQILKNLTHLQSILLFKDSSARQISLYRNWWSKRQPLAGRCSCQVKTLAGVWTFSCDRGRSNRIAQAAVATLWRPSCCGM